MKPVFYIQFKGEDPANQNLVYAIQEAGYETIVEKYIPFDGMDFSSLPEAPIIAHGTIGLIKTMQRKTKCCPLAWCEWKKLAYSHYCYQYGNYLLNNDYQIRPFGDLERLKDKIFTEKVMFFRPNENNKEFNGQAVAKYKFDSWYQIEKAYMVNPDCLCIIAPAKKIYKEYRLVMANQQYITGSQYLVEGIIEHHDYVPTEVILFAEKVARIWEPDKIYCLDICTTDDGPKVLEIGSINCAGLYAMDVRKIIAKEAEIAINEWNDLHFGDISDLN